MVPPSITYLFSFPEHEIARSRHSGKLFRGGIRQTQNARSRDRDIWRDSFVGGIRQTQNARSRYRDIWKASFVAG